jgi:hydroxysqualene synthase
MTSSTHAHYENFPVASVLCPPALRPAVVAIYAFARTADDLADEGDASTAQRLADLQAYGEDLRAIARSEPASVRWSAVFTPLQRVLRQHALPVHLLQDLLSAFTQDLRQSCFQDRPALLDYCSRSANPIGRLLLHLYGVTGPRALAQSDAICTALQLINFWQDLGIDIARGRLYVPLQDSLRHGVTPSMLCAQQGCAATSALVAELVAWARSLMRQGMPLVHTLPGRVGWELRLVVQGGLAILRKIERKQYRALSIRPTVQWHDGPAILWRAMRMRRVKGRR